MKTETYVAEQKRVHVDDDGTLAIMFDANSNGSRTRAVWTAQRVMELLDGTGIVLLQDKVLVLFDRR